MSSTKGSKFAGAFGALNTVRDLQPDETENDVQTLEHQNIEASQHTNTKVPDPKVRTTIYLQPSTHKALKHRAIETRRDVSAILQELADQWLQEQNALVS